MIRSAEMIRIAAVGDMHLGRGTYGPPLQTLFGQVGDEADILVLCGDLTDRGEPEEARLLARALSAIPVPIVAVLGNHDFESGKQQEVTQILCDAGVRLLDGDSVEVLGIGFAGVKGFAGGFGRRALGPWGEEVIKRFVHEALDEALKLETALSRLRTPRKVVVLHYAPIAGTVEGEPLEIYPFLGCSRLEEPLSRYPVDVVFHGHAHNGAPEGRTMGDVPVYNVSMSLLEKTFPGRPPLRIIELSRDGSPAAAPAMERRAGDRRTTDAPA